MSGRKQKGINFLAIEGMELYGVDSGKVLITCVPIGPDEVRQRKFGFMCGPDLLRALGEGLVKVADAAKARAALQDAAVEAKP
jgi:hypothetical protein